MQKAQSSRISKVIKTASLHWGVIIIVILITISNTHEMEQPPHAPLEFGNLVNCFLDPTRTLKKKKHDSR